MGDMDWTPLMEAAKEGYHKCVELLIQAGADVNYQDEIRRTALIEAAGSGNYKCVEAVDRCRS